MGRIPEFTTQKLASSDVGVLGADTSQEQALGAIAAATKQVASQIHQQEQERQKILDVVEAERQLREFEGTLSKASGEIQTKFVDQPEDGVKEIGRAGEELINLTLEDISSPNVQAMVARGSSAVLRSANRSARKWGSDQQIIVADENFNRVTNLDSADILQNPSVKLYQEKLGYHEQRDTLARGIYGTQSPQKMQEGRESLSKSLIYGMMEKQPLEAKKLLDGGFFSGILTTDDQVAFGAKVDEKIKGWNDTLDFNATIQTLEMFQGAEKLWTEGELTTATVDVMEDNLHTTFVEDGQGGTVSLMEKFPQLQEQVDDLRTIAAQRTDINSIENIQIVADLEDEIRGLNISGDKRDAQTNLSEMIRVRGKIIKAAANGSLKPDKTGYFLNQLTTPLMDKLQDAPEKAWHNFITKFFTSVTPENVAYDRTNAFLEDSNFSQPVKDRMKADVLTGVVEEITKIRSDREITGGDVSNEEALAITNKAIQKAQAKQNVALQHIPEEGKVLQLKSGKIIKVFANGIVLPLN